MLMGPGRPASNAGKKEKQKNPKKTGIKLKSGLLVSRLIGLSVGPSLQGSVCSDGPLVGSSWEMARRIQI